MRIEMKGIEDPTRPLPLPERSYQAMVTIPGTFEKADGRLEHLRGIPVSRQTPEQRREEAQLFEARFRVLFDPI
jgi:hypothetical protein